MKNRQFNVSDIEKETFRRVKATSVKEYSYNVLEVIRIMNGR